MGFENNLQMILLAVGVALLCWMMLRSRFRRKKKGGYLDESKELGFRRTRLNRPLPFSGVASSGAHPDFLRWQVEFHDMTRQMKAELDSKLVAVKALTKEYDAAAGQLKQLIGEAKALGLSPARVQAEPVNGPEQLVPASPRLHCEQGNSSADSAAVLTPTIR